MKSVQITEDRIRAAASDNVSRKAILKARVIGEEDDGKAGKTKAAPEDPFAALVSDGQVVEPPFDMLALSMMGEQSSELGQVIEAMEVNIEGFGQRFKSRLVKPADGEIPKPLKVAERKERARLENFFAYATDESFTEFRRKIRNDLEYTGNAYSEVIRDNAGRIQGFVHIPSYQIRLGIMEKMLTKYKRPILELQEDGSIKVANVTAYKRFRPFAQSRYTRRANLSIVGGVEKVWFKEFGDTRRISCETGKPIADGEDASEDKLANEMIHWKLYSPRTPYGLPRYIGNLLSIMGDRASEEINFLTFKNNNIPSMVIAVSNGQLTQGSIDRITSFVESDIQGSSNYSKFIVIEAEGDMEGEDASQVKLDIKPLTKDQHDDALFQNYSSNNQDKVRRAFRMPPIFVGKSDDYATATVDSSRKLADEQIFAPERNVFDDFINRKLFPAMGVVYHKFLSNSPNTTDNTELVRMMGAAEKTGAQTPTIARTVLEEILGRELPEFPSDFPANVPFSLTMAQAVKNKADGAEPGQQVTALKSKSGDDVVTYLLNVRKELEAQWTSHLVEDEDGCCESGK
jgi:PBSX family phage portal protein